MAKRNLKDYLKQDGMNIKKCFYVLRPLMACMWIEKYKESPPMRFEKLLTQLTEKELLDTITALLERKRSGLELGLEPVSAIINEFIDSTLKHFEETADSFDAHKKPRPESLEESFISILDYVESAWFAGGRGR